MKKRVLGFILIFPLALGLSACGQNAAGLRVEKTTSDSVHELNQAAASSAVQTQQTVQAVTENTKIVTGEPATTIDDKGANDTISAKDKPGAIAVKTEY